tara:strand:- start:13528 stop:14658 length:1131 start_codon:yes stop_codon:yes gene_type:complete
MKIAVIGSGAIGVNIAYRLAAKGAEVSLVEARSPGSGTSRASFSWLSSFPQVSWSEDPGRAKLRLGVHTRFASLADELGGDWLDWCGTLTWATAAPGFREAVTLCQERGIDIRIIDKLELAELAPELKPRSGEEAFVYEPFSGWVDAPRLIERLAERFSALGGELISGRSVVSVTIHAGETKGVVLDNGRVVEADAVVNATGSWASQVSAMAGLAIPIDLVPGIMIYASGPEGLPHQVINGPQWLMRPEAEQKIAIHWRGEGLTAVHGGNANDPHSILAAIAQHVPALEACRVDDVRVGVRAIPHGGPVLGELPWLRGFYIAVSHGGIGWGPVWADLVAREILDKQNVAELDGMRPERFYLDPPALGRFADDGEQR